MTDPIVNAGDLRYQVQLQAQDGTQDDAGGITDTWSLVATVWAAISTTSSREVYQASQFVAQATHLLTIRWSPAFQVVGGMRAVFGDRTFQVQTVENVQERNRVMKLICVELNGVV